MAIIGSKISGNTKNISKFWVQEMENLWNYTVPKNQIFTEELALAMAGITHNLGSEIAVYLDRNGKVVLVQAGDKNTVALTKLNRREGQNRLSGLRCIHTHPGGNAHLSMVDLAALPLLGFDAMVAIGVAPKPEDSKEDTLITGVALAWGVLGKAKPQEICLKSLGQVLALDLTLKLAEIEKAASKELALHSLEVEKTKAILVTITGKESEETAQFSLKELKELAETAGLEVVDEVIQKRATPESATYIGKGKANELQLSTQVLGADTLIFDNELSPMQIRNLEQITGKAILDRSMVILDIFAQRAQSNEGKLQVELAQLQYMMPRLVGGGEVLSRLGGGIGTRGPGETKLEMDKRNIRNRIDELEGKLEQIAKTRKLHQQQRQDKQVPIVALVGYTNSGKSTLLNQLTQAGVLAEDKLFATLDTTTRKVELATGRIILLTDTVGFIRKLPHHLVAAFRATLEEVVQAELLLHVMDSSCTELEQQVEAVNKVLMDLGCVDKPTISVLNKTDLVESQGALIRLGNNFDNAVLISAKNQTGIDELLAKVLELLPMTDQEIDLVLPYEAGSLLSQIHATGKVFAESYENEGVAIKAVVPAKTYQLIKAAGYISNN